MVSMVTCSSATRDYLSIGALEVTRWGLLWHAPQLTTPAPAAANMSARTRPESIAQSG